MAVTIQCNKQSEKSHMLLQVKTKNTLGIHPVEVNRAYTFQTPLQNVKDM